MNLKGKVALVTGSAKRIGRTIALGLAEKGCHTVVHYNRSAKAASQTVADIEAAGVKAWSISADLNNEAEVRSIIPFALEKAGRLDILINNASMFPPDKFLTAESKTWDENMRVNLKAPFLLSQEFAQTLPNDRQGKIINLLDAFAMRPRNHHFSYTISKYGLAGLTKATAYALAARNIQVNGIALGIILSSSDDQAAFARMTKSIPVRRTGFPEEVVQALLYLLQTADYVTGEVLHVDGGKHLT